jgi:hypothetical protein
MSLIEYRDTCNDIVSSAYCREGGLKISALDSLRHDMLFSSSFAFDLDIEKKGGVPFLSKNQFNKFN